MSQEPGSQERPDANANRQADKQLIQASRRMAERALLNPDASAETWDRIFDEDSPTAQHVAEAVAYLHDRGHYNVAVEGLLSAIRHDQAAPWIYDVLALEMKLAGRPEKDIVRVLSSRVDFTASDVSQMLIAVAMLSRFEAWGEANALAEEAAELNPELPEVWMLGRSVADKSGDTESRIRTRCGILKYVWTDGFELHHEEARKVLAEKAVEYELAGQSELGESVRTRLADAAAVDLQIILKWVGSADLDLIVTEPGDAECSFRQRLTVNGGRLISDDTAVPSQTPEASRKCSEHYVCHTAPDGKYDIAVRFVLGKAVAGTAVVEIIRNAHTSQETRTTKTLTLGKKDVLTSLVLSSGRAGAIDKANDK